MTTPEQLLHIERSDGDLVMVQDSWKGHRFLRITTTKIELEGTTERSVVLRVSELGPLIRVLTDAQREIGYTGPHARVVHERKPARTTTSAR